MKRNVVVTGCSSGFGRDVSVRLAASGDRVCATMRGTDGRNAEAAKNLQSQPAAQGAALRVVDMDVTSDESTDAAAAAILAEMGAPDVVINNAGQMYVGITETFTTEEFRAQLDVNVLGVHRVNRAFLPSMRARRSGLIVNISSIAGRLAAPFNAIYHASKWALEGYSLALRTELASSGVDVVVVEPGPFTTALFPAMRVPADVERRAATYPPVVHETAASLGRMFATLFNDPATPTDPSLVVDRLCELIDRRAGTRPFRTVVGVDMGVAGRNGAVAPLDAQFLENAGLVDFAVLRPLS